MISPHPQGLILAVRAQPGAKKDAILGERNGVLRISITAAPERGKANEAIVEILAKTLGLRRSQVTIVTGETSRDKRFLIAGVEAEDVRSRLGIPLPP